MSAAADTPAPALPGSVTSDSASTTVSDAKAAAAAAAQAAKAARQAAKEAEAAAKEERRKEREAARAAKAAAKAALPKRPRGRPRKNPVVAAEAAPAKAAPASESGGTTDMDNMSAASSTHFDADSDSEIAVLRAELSALKARHAALEVAYHKASHTLDAIRGALSIAAL